MADHAEYLQAENEITRLLIEYCSAIDAGEFGRAGKLFEKGTWFYDPESPITGTEAATKFLEDLVILYDGVPKTRHTLSNVRVDVAENLKTAYAECNVVVFQAAPGSQPQIIFQGAYTDTFIRDEDGWRIDERRFSCDGIGDLSKHLKAIASPTIR